MEALLRPREGSKAFEGPGKAWGFRERFWQFCKMTQEFEIFGQEETIFYEVISRSFLKLVLGSSRESREEPEGRPGRPLEDKRARVIPY